MGLILVNTVNNKRCFIFWRLFPIITGNVRRKMDETDHEECVVYIQNLGERLVLICIRAVILVFVVVVVVVVGVVLF